MSRPNAFSTKHKIIFSAVCYIAIFSFGCGYGMLNTSLQDIAENTRTDFANVSHGLVVNALFAAIGFVVWGKVTSLMDRRPFLIFALIGQGIAMILLTYTSSLVVLLMLLAVFGFCVSLTPLSSNAWILQIWRERSNPVMQGLHFCFALGMTVSPIIVAPYLSREETDANGTGTISEMPIQFRTTGEDGHVPSLLVPYLLPSTLSLMCALAFGAIYFSRNYSATGNFDERVRRMSHISATDVVVSTQDSVSESTVDRDNSILVIAIAIAVSVFNQCNESNIMSFTSSFIFYLTGDKQAGAHMVSVVAGSNAVFRLVSVVTANYIAPQFMVIGHFGVLIIANLLLLLFAKLWSPILVISFILIGAGQSSIFPSLLSLYNQKIHMTSRILGIILVADAVSLMIVPLFAGAFLESFPLSYPIFNIAVILGALICFSVFYLRTRYITLGANQRSNNIHH